VEGSRETGVKSKKQESRLDLRTLVDRYAIVVFR
jgi:hypothetical protein